VHKGRPKARHGGQGVAWCASGDCELGMTVSIVEDHVAQDEATPQPLMLAGKPLTPPNEQKVLRLNGKNACPSMQQCAALTAAMRIHHVCTCTAKQHMHS
jgi:hypothetical protein